MFSRLLKHAIVLGLAFLASGTLGAPVSEEAALERRAPTGPCSSTIARIGNKAAAEAASGCFEELRKHIIEGGESGVLGSSSGAHLASRVLASAPQKAGHIDAATLVMNAAVTGSTKTLWLDDGLNSLITAAETALAAQSAAKAQVTAAEKSLASNLAKHKVKALQNAVKKAKDAVKPLTAAQTLMLNTIKPAVPNRAELYTQKGIETMCIEAMKQSFARHKNLLKDGVFRVTAPNLGKTVPVRLLEGKGRINSCFPVL